MDWETIQSKRVKLRLQGGTTRKFGRKAESKAQISKELTVKEAN
jgi:hypothetical protein